jgi:hypothetical protein
MKLSEYFPEMEDWTPVEPEISKAPPVYDDVIQSGRYLRTTLPLSLQYSPDTLKQFNRPGISSFRIAPLSPGSAPAINSASGGVSTRVSTQISGKISAQVVAQAINQALPGAVVNETVFPSTLNNVGDSALYSRVSTDALTNHHIDPSKSGVLSVGSRAQSITTLTAYTSTTTSITVYWDGTNGSQSLTVFRDDGTNFNSPGSQTITGLTLNTLYFIYMYWDEITGGIKFASVAGAVGSPAYAYTAANNLAAQQQILRTSISLSLILATTGFTTPAAGTGSGGGGGGGGGGRGGRPPNQ